MGTQHTLASLKEAVVALFRADTRLSGGEILQEFPGREASYPLDVPILIVGIEEIEIAPSGFGGYLGMAQGEGFHGLDAEIVLRIECLIAQDSALSTWERLLEGVYDCLLSSSLGITHLWYEATKAKTSHLATQATIKARLRTLLATGKEVPAMKQVSVHYSGGEK